MTGKGSWGKGYQNCLRKRGKEARRDGWSKGEKVACHRKEVESQQAGPGGSENLAHWAGVGQGHRVGPDREGPGVQAQTWDFTRVPVHSR